MIFGRDLCKVLHPMVYAMHHIISPTPPTDSDMDEF